MASGMQARSSKSFRNPEAASSGGRSSLISILKTNTTRGNEQTHADIL